MLGLTSLFLCFIAGFLSVEALAGIQFHQYQQADYFTYIPERTPKYILVVAHGMLGKNQEASEVAKTYIKRWIKHAKQHDLFVIAPVFDTQRFGNLGGGYGGYRNLFGKHISADKFVNKLVEHYRERTASNSEQFYLYGHSAGDQFINRYTVSHPGRIIKAVISSAGRYSYPTKKYNWPHGAAKLQRTIKWKDGTQTEINRNVTLTNYAKAATKLAIVIGAEDIKEQPVRSAH
jgi:poly(3-hydroxybutyrate) depolymerase